MRAMRHSCCPGEDGLEPIALSTAKFRVGSSLLSGVPENTQRVGSVLKDTRCARAHCPVPWSIRGELEPTILCSGKYSVGPSRPTWKRVVLSGSHSAQSDS